jgi:hypothetical protein
VRTPVFYFKSNPESEGPVRMGSCCSTIGSCCLPKIRHKGLEDVMWIENPDQSKPSCCSSKPKKFVQVIVTLHITFVKYVGKKKQQLSGGTSFMEENFHVIVNEEDEHSPTTFSITFYPSKLVLYPLDRETLKRWAEGIAKNATTSKSPVSRYTAQIKEKAGMVADALDSPVVRFAATKGVQAAVAYVGLGTVAAMAAPAVVAAAANEVRKIAVKDG